MPFINTATRRMRSGCCARAEKRPRGGAAEQRHKLPPPYHSITSSARASSVGGTSMPRVMAGAKAQVE
jgi:hypothetical protein